MAQALNISTMRLAKVSVSPALDLSQWLVNPDLSAVAGVAPKHWKLDPTALAAALTAQQAARAAEVPPKLWTPATVGVVVPMTQAERAAIDAAEAQAAADAASVEGDRVIVLRRASRAGLPTQAKIDAHAPGATLVVLLNDWGGTGGGPGMAVYAGNGRWILSAGTLVNIG